MSPSRHADAEDLPRRDENAETPLAILGLASVGIAQINPLDGRLLRFNEKFCRITGYTSAELLDLHFADLTHPEDRSSDWEVFRRAVRGESPDYHNERRCVCKDGSVIWVRVNGAFLRNPDGQAASTLVLCEDITERKQAERVLRENQERLLLAQKAGRLGTFDLDLRSGKGFWSEERKELFGVLPEHEPTRDSWWSLVPEPNRAALLAGLAGVFGAQRREWQHVYRIQRLDGQERWIEDWALFTYDDAGQPLRMVGTTKDVTREARARERAREQQREFRFSALRAVWILAVSIFLAEGVIMAGLAEIPSLWPWYSAVLDSFTLIALVSPMLYFFAFRPLVRILRQREAVEEDLRLANENLEARVRDRTARLERANEKLAAEIAEREKAEEKSRRAKEEWERTFDAVPDLIAILDDRHSILRANRAMAERLGLPLGKCIGRTCHELLHGTTCPHDACPHSRTLADGREHTLELNEPRLGGDFLISTTPLRDENGRQIGSVHVARDISGIKRAEAALRESQAALQKSHHELEQRVRQRTEDLTRANAALESEVAERRRAELALTAERQRFQDVFDRLPAYLVLLSPDYRVAFANRFFEERFGKAGGRRCFEHLFNRTTPCENCQTFEVLNTRTPRIWEWPGPDGHVYEIHDSPFVDVDGSPLILEVGIDITDRKASEHERQHLRNELARVTRITTAGQLSAALAHELNQPLGAIVCNVQTAQQLLAAVPVDSSELKETLRDIEADSKRAGTVIHQLRSLFQRVGQSKVPLELNQLLESTLQLMHSEFVIKGVEVQADLHPRLPGILGNRVELQQVALNLLTNALDAMTLCEPGARRLRITSSLDGPDKVHTAFQDSGLGVPPDHLPRLFDPFFTTKAGGMGMGLPICRTIIEAHGGRLWVENNPDVGATFHLTLPAIPAGTDGV